MWIKCFEASRQLNGAPATAMRRRRSSASPGSLASEPWGDFLECASGSTAQPVARTRYTTKAIPEPMRNQPNA
jgi:hypothetical protein